MKNLFIIKGIDENSVKCDFIEGSTENGIRRPI